MNVTEILILVCAALILAANVFLIVKNIRSKNNITGITMEPGDYLALIFTQLEEAASDIISLLTVKREDYSSENDYYNALLEHTKENLIDAAEEYGINPRYLELISDSDLDNYLLSAIANALAKRNSLEEPVESVEESVEEELNEKIEDHTIDISDSLEDIYR